MEINVSEANVGYTFKAHLGHAPVTTLKEQARWLTRGKQKAAVAAALRKPLTASQLHALAQRSAPRLQLRDVWFILEQCREHGLVECLTPKAGNGKLHYWTTLGLKAAQRAFKHPLGPIPAKLSWQRYRWVACGRLRQAILVEISKTNPKDQKTAAKIRRALREKYAVTLSSFLRTLNDLVAANFITYEVQEGRKIYRLTLAGTRIATQLRR